MAVDAEAAIGCFLHGDYVGTRGDNLDNHVRRQLAEAGCLRHLIERALVGSLQFTLRHNASGKCKRVESYRTIH
jgi:hypothetical protein